MNNSLSLGKLRGLQEIANPHGLFTITALDHRGSLQKALKPEDPKSIGYQEMVDYKIKLLNALAPHSSAILASSLHITPLTKTGRPEFFWM